MLKTERKRLIDYEFVCYGGENETKRFSHDIRRRITMDILPALRDAEGDLENWRRSPLKPLIEDAFKDIDPSDLSEISESIEEATEKIVEFDEVQELENNIGSLFSKMSGPKQDINPCLGFIILLVLTVDVADAPQFSWGNLRY